MARRIFRHTTSGPAFSTTIAGTETGMPLHADTPLPSAPTAVVVQALAQAAAVARAAAWSLAPTQEHGAWGSTTPQPIYPHKPWRWNSSPATWTALPNRLPKLLTMTDFPHTKKLSALVREAAADLPPATVRQVLEQVNRDMELARAGTVIR